jgi:hypothetical protein
MIVRASGWGLATVLLIGAGCGARALDDGMDMTGTGTGSGSTTSPPGMTKPSPPPPGVDLVATLRLNGGPGKLLVIGTNGGVVTSSTTNDGTGLVLPQDAETLDEAAAAAGLPVCSVEFQGLTRDRAAADANTLAVQDAVDACLQEDLTDMLGRLGGLKTPSTVVVIASNTAITFHSTNNGINYFYDADMVRLLHAARALYVPACVVAPDALAAPTYPEGQTPGLSVEDALARCGRM